MLKRLAALGAVLVVLGGCASALLPKLTPSQVQWAGGQWPGTDAASLESARQLYVSRCSGCHNLVTPDRHTPEEWDHYLDRMAPRAKLTAEEKDAVHRFILAAKQG